MKVICVNAKNMYNQPFITENKIYEAELCNNPLGIYIKDDSNNLQLYHATRFKPYNPINKLKAIIEEK